jgi:hypothetical protein
MLKNYDIFAIGAPQDTLCDIFLLTNIELMFYYCPTQFCKVPQSLGDLGVEKALNEQKGEEVKHGGGD